MSQRMGVALVVGVMLLTGTMGSPMGPGGRAWAQSGAIEDAQRSYDGSQFAQAITRLRAAITSGEVTGSDALRAKALLGRSLVKAGERVEARETFKSLLRQDGGYRLDPVATPPDEMEVFQLALQDISAEQVEAGRRVPASLGFFVGLGSGANKNFAELPHAGGGKDHFSSKTEFGGSVRFPIRPRWSLDIELDRFRATDADSVPVPSRLNYEATAIPLVLSAYWDVLPHERWRLNAFAGAGPMMATRGAIKFNRPGTGYFLADERVGTYLHAGVEGEWVMWRRFTVSGRLLGRYARASHLFKGSQIDVYSPTSPLANHAVDFSGIGAFLTVRGYIGY